MNKNKVSVAMAAYNGEKYIGEQIESILCQLRDEDELVISCDKSTDSTISIIESYIVRDNRVKVFKNPYKVGVVRNFQNAIEKSSGDIIFLADQDDVWIPNKIAQVLREFVNPIVAVVFHDAHLTDQHLNITAESTFALRGGAKTSSWGNLFRLSYIGCCMAFRAAYKNVIIPIPTIYRSHDWWIGCLLACGKTKMVAIDEKLIYHRQHDSNATPPQRPLLSYQIHVRWIIASNIIRRWRRKLKIDKQLLK